MNNFIQSLIDFNMNGIRAKVTANTHLSHEEIKQLEKVQNQLDNYLSGRPYQLGNIMVAIQVAIEDKEIGSFENGNMQLLTYFFEDEFNAIGDIYALKQDVDFYLQENSKNQHLNQSNENKTSRGK